MRVAVFIGGLSEKQAKGMENHARMKWEFAGKYSKVEDVLNDAQERVIEKHGGSYCAIEEGKFSHLMVKDGDSISLELKKELHNFYGIEIINFKKQKKIESEKLNEDCEVDVDLRDSGAYKEVVK